MHQFLQSTGLVVILVSPSEGMSFSIRFCFCALGVIPHSLWLWCDPYVEVGCRFHQLSSEMLSSTHSVVQQMSHCCSIVSLLLGPQLMYISFSCKWCVTLSRTAHHFIAAPLGLVVLRTMFPLPMSFAVPLLTDHYSSLFTAIYRQ